MHIKKISSEAMGAGKTDDSGVLSSARMPRMFMFMFNTSESSLPLRRLGRYGKSLALLSGARTTAQST